MEDLWTKGKDVIQTLQGASSVKAQARAARAANQQVTVTKELVKLTKWMVIFNGMVAVATVIYALTYFIATFIRGR